MIIAKKEHSSQNDEQTRFLNILNKCEISPNKSASSKCIVPFNDVAHFQNPICSPSPWGTTKEQRTKETESGNGYKKCKSS